MSHFRIAVALSEIPLSIKDIQRIESGRHKKSSATQRIMLIGSFFGAMFEAMDKLNESKKPATPVADVCQDWHRADIKSALEKAGFTLRQLSLQHGYAPGSLKATLDAPWPAAERIIATAIGVHPAQIWPTRYDADGNPKSGRNQRGIGRWSTRKSSSALNTRNVESAAAA